jgi:hypothetical protein
VKRFRFYHEATHTTRSRRLDGGGSLARGCSVGATLWLYYTVRPVWGVCGCGNAALFCGGGGGGDPVAVDSEAWAEGVLAKAAMSLSGLTFVSVSCSHCVLQLCPCICLGLCLCVGLCLCLCPRPCICLCLSLLSCSRLSVPLRLLSLWRAARARESLSYFNSLKKSNVHSRRKHDKSIGFRGRSAARI